MKRLLVIACIGLASCQTGASHIPPPHQLPGAAIGSAIENSRYNARRTKVKASIRTHLGSILAQADRGGGTHFQATCSLARVSDVKCAKLARQVSSDAHIYKTGSAEERVEKLTVAFMVHGN